MNLLSIPVSHLPGAFLFACIFACTPVLLSAQPSDTIVANPSAVTLRHIWKVTGVFEENRVGLACGSLGRLGDDSLSSFAVYFGDVGDWKIYKGGVPAPDTVAEWVQRIPTPVPQYPIVGDFYGDGSKIVCFGQNRFWDDPISYRLYFFRSDGNGLLTTDPTITFIHPLSQPCIRGIVAADLDGDGADELILSRSCSFPEIWIYKGGAEFLSSSQPDIVIADPDYNSSSGYDLHVIDADNDTYPDLIVNADYDGHPKLKVWYGSEGTPWNWTDTPDRVLPLEGTGLNLQPVIADFDGDYIPDLATTLYGGDTAGIYIYRSGSRKDFRSRSFSREDADNILRINTSMYRAFGSGTGYLNDSSRRYATLPLIFPGFDRFDDSEMLLLSGGKDGPNGTIDARYRPELDGITPGRIFRQMSPLPDCNGDGWDDFLTSSYDWFGFEHGIALVLAGGPYIPNDDPTVSVREEPVAGESGGLYLWPNPVIDELNIAWKGNLPKLPHRFEVHDMTGRRVASGTLSPYVGAAQWRCGDVAAGTYLLTAYAEDGAVIASVRMVKQ